MDGVADVSVVVGAVVVVVGSVDVELTAVVSVDVVGVDVAVEVDVGAGVQTDTEVSGVVGGASAGVSADVLVTLSLVIPPPAAVSGSACSVAQPDTSVTTTTSADNRGLTIQS